jgi:hypothetical protein
MSGKKIRRDIERALQDYAALPDLQALVDAGCDRKQIISYMGLAFWADDCWKTLMDMDLRGFKRALKQIRNCASMIDRLNCSSLIHDLSLETLDPRFVGLHESPTLPERLREYANKLDSLRGVFGLHQKLRLDAWKALIVATVTEGTKKPHDSEVSSMIAGVLNDPKYSLAAHSAWRRKHGHLIERMRKTVRH